MRRLTLDLWRIQVTYCSKVPEPGLGCKVRDDKDDYSWLTAKLQMSAWCPFGG